MSSSDFASTYEARPAYAGFWVRFLAYFLDGIILYIPNAILGAIVFSIFGLSPLMEEMNRISAAEGTMSEEQAAQFMAQFFAAFIPAFTVITLLSLVLTWLYCALMESSSKQGTLGKMALGIVVTDLQGDRISFARATGRYFMKAFISGILLIGFIIAAFTERKQALHDMVASTLVLKRR